MTRATRVLAGDISELESDLEARMLSASQELERILFARFLAGE